MNELDERIKNAPLNELGTIISSQPRHSADVMTVSKHLEDAALDLVFRASYVEARVFVGWSNKEAIAYANKHTRSVAGAMGRIWKEVKL